MYIGRRVDSRRIVIALLIIGLMQVACAGARAPILVGQTGLSIVQSIGTLQITVKQLTDAKILSPQAALAVQQALLAANDRLKPLPDLLRTIDAAQKAHDPTASIADQTIAILTAVSTDLVGLLPNIPVAETTKALISLIQQSQQLVRATLTEVATIKRGTS